MIFINKKKKKKKRKEKKEKKHKKEREKITDLQLEDCSPFAAWRLYFCRVSVESEALILF